MNITDIAAKRACTSCQMCAAICPKNAIVVELDNEGFYRPKVDTKLCVNCGICTKVCYKFDETIEPFGRERLSKTILYAASAKDSDVVKNTTSGGIADVLARQLLKDGYKCIGVVYDSEKDVAVDTIVDKEADLSKFRGSKYIQSYTYDAFTDVVKHCKDQKFAIFGTPCQIYAVDKYLEWRGVRDEHLLIDLYCHGCPSINVWKKYIKEVKRIISLDKIDNANFRSKVKGWGNFYVVVVVVDGKPVFYSDNRTNDFFELFFSDQILNEACNDCLLRSSLAYTDIRLGDFWGKRYVLDNKGVSAVSVVTTKGKKVFGEIADKIYFKEENYSDFLPWQSWEKMHNPKPELRSVLLEQLSDPDIPLRESVLTIYRHQSIKRKLVRYGKLFIHALPIKIEKRIRRIYYRLHK